jgi:hypothetical protein
MELRNPCALRDGLSVPDRTTERMKNCCVRVRRGDMLSQPEIDGDWIMAVALYASVSFTKQTDNGLSIPNHRSNHASALGSARTTGLGRFEPIALSSRTYRFQTYLPCSASWPGFPYPSNRVCSLQSDDLDRRRHRSLESRRRRPSPIPNWTRPPPNRPRG